MKKTVTDFYAGILFKTVAKTFCLLSLLFCFSASAEPVLQVVGSNGLLIEDGDKPSFDC